MLVTILTRMNRIIKQGNERVIIFIDGSNFYHSVREVVNIYDNQIDFKKFINYLVNKREIIAVYYYNASLDRSYNKKIYWKQQQFFNELRNIPKFNVILCRMRKSKNEKGKITYSIKGDDIYLGTDMVAFAYEDKFDTAILVSGDGDFEPAIKKVQKLGKRVENAYFSISRSNLLKKICNSSACLNDVIKRCLKTK